MQDFFVPTLLLIVLPALWIGSRLRGSQRTRLAVAAVVAGLLIWSFPRGGLDFDQLKHLQFFLAAATALLLVCRRLRIGWGRRRTTYRTTLGGLAAFALVLYSNFLDFHGLRTFVHLHDAAHYYLGAKYYDELGYTDLYTAMLRAEAEVYDDHFKTLEARDLETYRPVHIRTLLERSDTVKERFSPGRWYAFLQDVAFFREGLGDQYATVLLDHGFNPTPVWAALGGPLANRVPAGSRGGILLLCLLDVALLAAMFGMIAWAFGLEAMLLSGIAFGVIFGAGFGWTGGAFLRFPWLFGVVGAACCLQRRRHLAAGGLLALATALRVFPIFFLLPLALRALAVARRRRGRPWRARLPPRYRALAIGLLGGGALLFGLTLLLPRGLDHWLDFRANMRNHVRNIAPNVVGLTEVLAFRPFAEEMVTQEEFDGLKERRRTIYRTQLLLIFLPTLFYVAHRVGGRRDLDAMVLGLPLLLTGLSLAAYYYVALLLVILSHRHAPERLALFFAVEAASYVMPLFEERDGPIFIVRTLLLGWLFVVLEIEQRRATTMSSE